MQRRAGRRLVRCASFNLRKTARGKVLYIRLWDAGRRFARLKFPRDEFNCHLCVFLDFMREFSLRLRCTQLFLFFLVYIYAISIGRRVWYGCWWYEHQGNMALIINIFFIQVCREWTKNLFANCKTKKIYRLMKKNFVCNLVSIYLDIV